MHDKRDPRDRSSRRRPIDPAASTPIPSPRGAAQGGARAGSTALQMLDHVATRLDAIRTLQGREAALTRPGAERRWWTEVGDRHRDVAKPDPTRWAPVARAYERAAEDAARGDVRAAAAHLREAETLERSAQEALDLVETRDVDLDPSNPWHDRVPAGMGRRLPLPPSIRDAVEDILDERSHVDDPPTRAAPARRASSPDEDEASDDDTADR